MRISVFGGTQTKSGDKAYEEALELGRLLGTRHHTVLNGGYFGTMEAVSRGTAENGGHVIGVTCQAIEQWRGSQPNEWVQEEWRFTTLKDRLFALIENCDLALALPGGVGTLLEITALWNQMIITALPRIPLLMIGQGWQSLFEHFYQTLGAYVPEKERLLIGFMKDVQSAVKRIDQYIQDGFVARKT